MKRYPFNKYGAKKTKADGITFDSKREAARYNELKLLQKAGKIKNLIIHPRYQIFEGKEDIKPIHYCADFQYVMDGQIYVEDVKGFITKEYALKKKMFLALYGKKFVFKEIK
jgi:hypothetical protein